MRTNTPAPDDAAPNAHGEPAWANAARQLTTAWLTSFSQAITALSRDGLARMFHEQAVVFGAVPGGLGPASEFDALHFALVANSARIAPMDRTYTLVTVGWLIRPVLDGSPPEHGNATFVLYSLAPRFEEDGKLVSKGCVTCVHAHYSRRLPDAKAARVLPASARISQQ